ncbi:hypothetical protein AVEN_139351-1 [Araneus ventricosus]|uniref:Uncharacterized protein n=1 Tax=Araneus ventricosus TaxID=182803 RepID=A0A4Y2GEH1_ARAVE|nr:hypothetical protein AVEN_139351-1 [Araneus ventricosus]
MSCFFGSLSRCPQLQLGRPNVPLASHQRHKLQERRLRLKYIVTSWIMPNVTICPVFGSLSRCPQPQLGTPNVPFSEIEQRTKNNFKQEGAEKKNSYGNVAQPGTTEYALYVSHICKLVRSPFSHLVLTSLHRMKTERNTENI